ncbi:MAG: hypothetical protein AAF702_44495 [Chloroflexota bacterium]
MGALYCIKRLEWTKGVAGVGTDVLLSKTPFYTYFSLEDKGAYYWGIEESRYTPSFYQGRYECDSVGDGQLRAEEHWVEVLKKCLVEYEFCADGT